MHTVLTILSLLPFYLLGAFPTGHIIARRRGVDIVSHGSGNVGATNVARVLGKKAGILTLVGDVAKGALGVGIARLITTDLRYVSLVALVVMLGHCVSLPPKLKGGKGVATSLGAVLCLSPSLAVAGLLSFIVVLKLSKIVSLASVTAALVIPLSAVLTDAPQPVIYSLSFIALVVVFRHKANLKRLTEGSEPRTSFGSKSSKEQ